MLVRRISIMVVIHVIMNSMSNMLTVMMMITMSMMITVMLMTKIVMMAVISVMMPDSGG